MTNFRVIVVERQPSDYTGEYRRDIFLCNAACCTVCQLKYHCFTTAKYQPLVVEKSYLVKLFADYWSSLKLLKLATKSGVYAHGTRRYKELMAKIVEEGIPVRYK